MKLLRKYRFFAVLLAAELVLPALRPEGAARALSLSARSAAEMLSIIPPVFVLLGLMDVWIPKETMTKYMGRGAGAAGPLCAFLLGSFAAGPLYAAFPIAAMLLKKGASFFNVFLFLGAWSTTKLPQMLFEISQLGARFAAVRFALNLAVIALIALLMDKTAGARERAEILKRAEEMSGKH